MSSQSNLPVLATLVVGIIIVVAFVGYAFYSDNANLTSLSQQNSALGQQVAGLNQQVSVLEQRTAVTLTNTVIVPSISTSTTTQTTTSVVYSTVTSTSDVYPPSNSTYPLTYIDGNATNTEPNCGSFILSVFITYEIHQTLPSTLIVWTQFDNGVLYQPTSQQIFPSQAYLTVQASYSYSSGRCGVGYPTSVTSWVTDSRNNMLTPTETFVVIVR